MFAQQLCESLDAPFLIAAHVVVDVPAEIILAEFEVVFGARADDVIERVHTKVFRVAEFGPERFILDAATERPHRVDEWEVRELVPGGAEVPDFVGWWAA